MIHSNKPDLTFALQYQTLFARLAAYEQAQPTAMTILGEIGRYLAGDAPDLLGALAAAFGLCIQREFPATWRELLDTEKSVFDQLARLHNEGEEIYGHRSAEQYKVRELLASASRHALEVACGRAIDPDSGLSHLYHCIWNLVNAAHNDANKLIALRQTT